MHSFEFKREAEVALKSLEQFSKFIEDVRRVSGALEVLPTQLGRISIGSQNAIATAGGELKAAIDNVRSIVGGLSLRQTFKDIEELSSLLVKFRDGNLDDSGMVEKTNSDLQEFSSDYEAYVASYQAAKAVPLVFSSGQLVSSLETLMRMYRFSVINLKTAGEVKDDGSQSEFSLYLSSVKDLRDFAGKLSAISELYEDIAGLLGVSLIDYPLIVDEVEAGSLWSKLFGEPRVIELMVGILRGSAGFVYRNYTVEGKLSSIPGKLESLDKIVDLTGRLEQAGVDTQQIHEEIRRATVSIAKNLNALLDSQSKIEVNGERHSVADEILKGLTGESWLRPRLAYEDKEDPPLSLPPSE